VHQRVRPAQRARRAREKAREVRREADKELGRSPTSRPPSSARCWASPDRRQEAEPYPAGSQKTRLGEAAVTDARRQVESRVTATESLAAADGRRRRHQALRPFFESQQLPNAKWIMSWDVRGTSHPPTRRHRRPDLRDIPPPPIRTARPIRVEQLSDGVIVHMRRRAGVGKPSPPRSTSASTVVVAFERNLRESIITLKENINKSALGLRFAVGEVGATWSRSPGPATPTAIQPARHGRVAPVRQLAERAYAALKDLIPRRTLVDLSLGQRPCSPDLESHASSRSSCSPAHFRSPDHPRKSRMSGERIPQARHRYGRREECFVRAPTLAAQFARFRNELPPPRSKILGITNEEPRPRPAPGAPAGPRPAPRQRPTRSRSTTTDRHRLIDHGGRSRGRRAGRSRREADGFWAGLTGCSRPIALARFAAERR